MDHEKLSKTLFQLSVLDIIKEYDKNYFSQEAALDVPSDVVSSFVASLPPDKIEKLRWMITVTMIDTVSTVLNIIDNNDSNTVGSMFTIKLDGEELTGQLQDMFFGEAEIHFPEYFVS